MNDHCLNQHTVASESNEKVTGSEGNYWQASLLVLVLLLLAVIVPVNGWSQTFDRLSIHGYGSWIFGQTDNDNRYLAGNEVGNYDNVNFALNLRVSA